MRNRLVKLVEQSPPDRMVTLTIRPADYQSPADAASRMAWAFPRFVAKARAWLDGKPFEYLAVWERTKAGYPHLHVLVRSDFIPQRLLSAWWKALTGAWIVDVQSLRSARAGGRYVTKYLTKDPDPFGQGRALRTSRNFLVEPMRPQGRRYCTLGPLKVYEGRAWDWMAEELQGLSLLAVDDSGQTVSRTIASLDGSEALMLLRWHRQRHAVRNHLRPPPPPYPLMEGSPWADREPRTPEAGPERRQGGGEDWGSTPQRLDGLRPSQPPLRAR